MDLRKFPMDNQGCRIDIGSFGYTSSEIQYKWTEDPIEVDEYALGDFILVDFITGNRNVTSKIGKQSVISVKFRFSRTLSDHFLRTYFPLIIIVMCSWVSFWLVRTKYGGEIVARVGLGITCCLAVVTIGFIGDTKLKVPYATALDVFVIICFAFVFLALVEYAFIHFIELYVKRVKYKDKDRLIHLQEMTKSLIMPIVGNVHIEAKLPEVPRKKRSKISNQKKELLESQTKFRTEKESSVEFCDIHSETQLLDTDIETLETESFASETDLHYIESMEVMTNNSVEWVTLYSSLDRLQLSQEFDDYEENDTLWSAGKNAFIFLVDLVSETMVGSFLQHTELYYDTDTAVDRFDRYCRVAFPSGFLLTNIVYWAVYL